MKVVDNYFKIEQDKPIREKVFLVRIASSIVFIVACLFSMAFAAYGFFSADLSSASNVISASRYSLDIIVEPVSQGISRQNDEIQATSTGIYLLEPGEYSLTLIKPTDDPTISSTGFASISLYDTQSGSKIETYYTLPIGTMLVRDENGDPVLDENGECLLTECLTRTFKIMIYEKAYLSVVPSWGSYSGVPFEQDTITFGDPSQNIDNTVNDQNIESAQNDESKTEISENDVNAEYKEEIEPSESDDNAADDQIVEPSEGDNNAVDDQTVEPSDGDNSAADDQNSDPSESDVNNADDQTAEPSESDDNIVDDQNAETSQNVNDTDAEQMQ